MKAIINGKRFDTEKAILIGETDNGDRYSVNDFSYWTAGLYKSPRSERFFLAGWGGAMSRFARPHGQNGQIGGEGIIPMSKADAQQFAERYFDAATIEEHFADSIEDA